jgi:hypothetical protein
MSLTNLNCTMSFLPCNSLNHVHGVPQYTPRGSIIPNGVPSQSNPYEIKWSKINLIGITKNPSTLAHLIQSYKITLVLRIE